MVTLVANSNAIEKFDLIKTGNYELLADQFISFLNRPKNPETKQFMVELLKKIPSEQLELVFLHEERPLSSFIPTSNRVEAIAKLIDKYGKYSLESNFFKGLSLESYGHTAFF